LTDGSMLDPFDENECAICMERKSETVLPCTHAFCGYCIEGWKQKSTTCPICRNRIGNSSDDWVLTGSGPEDSEIISYLTSALDKYSK